jgi:transposase-like protein
MNPIGCSEQSKQSYTSTKSTSPKGQGFVQPLAPHRHWHVDIAYVNIAGTFYFLCSILDGYSRYLVHWEIRPKMEEIDVEAIVQRAREKYPGENPRIISDNGPQFIAKDFKQFIRICGMTHVRTSPYYPQSNGKLERYHRTIKSDCIRPGTPLSLEDARRIIEKFVEHYNNVRLHSAIQYITPNDKLHGREKEILAQRDRKLEEARERRRLRRQQAKAACYNANARPEDKALLASNLSAAPGPEASQGGGEPPPWTSSTLLLAQCEKRNSENTVFSPLHPLVTC